MKKEHYTIERLNMTRDISLHYIDASSLHRNKKIYDKIREIVLGKERSEEEKMQLIIDEY